MDTTAIRVPRVLADEVTQALNQKYRLSRSQAVDQSLRFFLKLRTAHPTLPLKPDGPLPVQFGMCEVWLPRDLTDSIRDLCREHNLANPEAYKVRLGHVAQTALLHAHASLVAHGHRQAEA